MSEPETITHPWTKRELAVWARLAADTRSPSEISNLPQPWDPAHPMLGKAVIIKTVAPEWRIGRLMGYDVSLGTSMHWLVTVGSWRTEDDDDLRYPPRHIWPTWSEIRFVLNQPSGPQPKMLLAPKRRLILR